MNSPPADLLFGPLLGEGGGGAVYAARLRGIEVAVKVLRAELALSEKERRRFFEEAERMRRVQHAGLVSLLDVGALADGRPYLVMPLLHGETLAARIARGPIPLAQALPLVAQLAGAVDALHAAGLIHRDLKPENVMLVEGGSRAVLLDFGIARDLDAGPSTTTQAGKARGTPAYMAPERFFGAPANTKTDLYELAVTTYLMLAGRLPWADSQDPNVRLQPASIDPALVPPLVAGAILRALSTRPEIRPASAGEFTAQLAASVQGVPLAPPRQTGDATPVAAVPQYATTHTTKKSSPWIPIAAAGGALALTGAAALAVFFWFRSQSPTPATAAATTASASTPLPLPLPTASATTTASTTTTATATATATTTSTSTSKPRPTPTPTNSTSPPAGGTLPACRKLVDLYCSDAWKKTEGSMAGTLCTTWQGNLTRWSAMPETAHKSLDEGCDRSYAQGVNVLKERQRQLAADAGPR